MVDQAVILLFFTGLIAFVPEQNNSTRVEALLLNAQGHPQYLGIPGNILKHQAQCQGICILNGSCLCDLRSGIDGDSITEIVIPTNSGSRFLPDRPPRALNPYTAGDIGWLVNMSYVKPRDARVDPARLKGNVGAKLNFGWRDAATCLFEEVECKVDGNWYRRIFKVEFDDWLDPFDESQPVAELVVFRATSPDPVVKIAYKKNKVWYSQEIELTCDSGGCPILISNSMPSGRNPDELCDKCEDDSEVSSHFRVFGRLTGSGNGMPIHRKCEDDDYENLPKAFPELCQPLLNRPPIVTLGDRIICPAAVLSN